MKVLLTLITADVISFLLVQTSQQFISPISRRVANLSFVLWQVLYIQRKLLRTSILYFICTLWLHLPFFGTKFHISSLKQFSRKELLRNFHLVVCWSPMAVLEDVINRLICEDDFVQYNKQKHNSGKHCSVALV